MRSFITTAKDGRFHRTVRVETEKLESRQARTEPDEIRFLRGGGIGDPYCVVRRPLDLREILGECAPS
jgi:hypothetical protein